jgi:hypothetical protein
MDKKLASPHWPFRVVLATITIGLLFIVAVPTRTGSHRSKYNGIINHLRQIEGAKEEWAIEHGFTNGPPTGRIVTERELAPYLMPDYTRGKEFGAPALGEIYLIRKLNQPAEALLTKDFVEGIRSSPRGTIIRLEKTSEGGEETVLPDGSATLWVGGIAKRVDH